MRTNLSILRDLLDAAEHRTALSQYLRLDPPHRPMLEYPNWYLHWEKAARDVWRLKVLADHDDGVHQRINERAALKAIIDKYAHKGKIRVVESGRDCDGVEYSGGPGREIPATVYHFNQLEGEIGKWADGPFHLSIVPWEHDEPYESRDLVMEAFEDGHPHSISSRFP